MQWKAWAFIIGAGMFVLALIGAVVHSDIRLIGADLIGVVAAIVIVLLANKGRGAQAAGSALATIALLVIAIMAMTSHASPVLIAFTLAFAFAFAFLSWSKLSGRPVDAGRPKPA